jgi:hypothetical protein
MCKRLIFLFSFFPLMLMAQKPSIKTLSTKRVIEVCEDRLYLMQRGSEILKRIEWWNQNSEQLQDKHFHPKVVLYWIINDDIIVEEEVDSWIQDEEFIEDSLWIKLFLIMYLNELISEEDFEKMRENARNILHEYRKKDKRQDLVLDELLRLGGICESEDEEGFSD